MSWRKTGNVVSDGENDCLSLDLIVFGVLSLKAVVQKASIGDGGKKGFAWEDLWCPLSLWSPEGTISDIDDAKILLKRMKNAKHLMKVLSTTLEDTIEAISELVVQDNCEKGLASLPDEVLAQVFELCHLDELQSGGGIPYTATRLSAVCKRFRGIAIHLPLLWRSVGALLSKRQLAVHTARCRNLKVRIVGDFLERLPSFVNNIHPYQEWEELELDFADEKDGHRLFEFLRPRVQAPFATLKRLFVCNHGIKDFDDDEVSTYTILEADELVLASWRFPMLTHLKLDKILPSRPFQCPNVTHFEFAFSMCDHHRLVWDLRILRDFVQAMPELESLVFTFHDQFIFVDNINTAIDPLTLPHLRSLSITLNGQPPLLVVSRFMDLLDTERLTKLEIRIHKWESIPWSVNLDPPAQALDGVDGAWVKAFFVHSDLRCEHVRLFPEVTEFALDIVTPYSISSGCIEPPFDPMFAALPNVRALSLKLPEFVRINLIRWLNVHGGLRELRSMIVREYVYPYFPSYSGFFSKFSEMEAWGNFERLEVVEPECRSSRMERFEWKIGDKLVRTIDRDDSNFYPI